MMTASDIDEKRRDATVSPPVGGGMVRVQRAQGPGDEFEAHIANDHLALARARGERRVALTVRGEVEHFQFADGRPALLRRPSMINRLDSRGFQLRNQVRLVDTVGTGHNIQREWTFEFL